MNAPGAKLDLSADLAGFETRWISEVQERFLACHDPVALFEALRDSVRARVPVLTLHLSRLLAPGEELEVSHCWGERTRLFRQGFCFSRHQSLAGRALDLDGPLYTPDHRALEDPPAFACRATEDGVASSLVVPLSVRGRPRGAVCLGFADPDPLSAATQNLFVAVARSYGALHFWMKDAEGLEHNRWVDQALRRVGWSLYEGDGTSESLHRSTQEMRVPARASAVRILWPGADASSTEAANGADTARVLALLSEVFAERTGSHDLVLLDRAACSRAGGELLRLFAAVSAAVVPMALGDPELGFLCASRGPEDPPRWSELDLSFLVNSAQLVALALGRARAAAERAQAEQRLRRADALQAVGQLAGGVAHDFNNLLGSILGCVYTLAGGADDREELDRITGLCRRGGELTRQLLAFARHTPGECKPVALGAVLQAVCSLLQRTVEKSVTVRLHVEPGLPLVLGDRASLITAVLNLGLNARDAMAGVGAVDLLARAADGGVEVRVRDTGPGVPPDLRDRVFEPFFTTKPPDQGTGLGLSMVYATCRDHGGSVAIESTPGGGATFRVWLPAYPGGAEKPAGEAFEEHHPYTERVVLVVEDEDLVARLVGDTLAGAGYRTERVKSGIDALARLQGRVEEVGLVVLDLILPGLPGTEVLRLLGDLCPRTPVLVATGRMDLVPPHHRAQVLSKPFAAADILAAVAAVLRGATASAAG